MKMILHKRGLGAQILTGILIVSVAAGVSGAAVVVGTQHNDTSRTGANLQETVLKTSNVNVSTFGKLFSRAVDGQIYAQPLYVPGVVSSSGTHNVVYVCTEHNSVYAYDADVPGNSSPLWHVNFGAPVPATAISVNRNLVPEIGITSTPVIDPTAGILYVVAETYENSQAVFRLHALDLATGTEHFNNPVDLQLRDWHDRGRRSGEGRRDCGGAGTRRRTSHAARRTSSGARGRLARHL